VMLEHTWNTLDVTQQQILKSLSVFEGAFGLNVFMSLCDAPMDAFFGLIQKSLILKYDEMYRMHQLIGRYARQKLFFDPDKDALSARYLDHYSAYIHDLRQRALPVHEYLVAIEVEYPNIWNFRWMSGAFQPVYALSMSRFLMVYWEISHSVSVEDVIKVLRQFETNMQTLDARWHGLLYLQLARLHQHADQSEDALTYRARAFDLYCCNDQWLDHAVLYSLFAMSLNGAEATVISGNTEMRILTSVYFNLILMNLDMHDFQTTGDLLAQLRGSMTDDAGRVALYGAQAALAAAQARYADACDLYREANNVPAVESQALLRSMIAGSLLRLAFQLGRDDLFEPVLVNLLTDTARQPTSAALANVLDFCRQIRDENAGSPFGALVNRALQSLSPDVRQQPQVAAFLAG
jgi:tetratricopeptide (TPR) repeat protein